MNFFLPSKKKFSDETFFLKICCFSTLEFTLSKVIIIRVFHRVFIFDWENAKALHRIFYFSLFLHFFFIHFSMHLSQLILKICIETPKNFSVNAKIYNFSLFFFSMHLFFFLIEKMLKHCIEFLTFAKKCLTLKFFCLYAYFYASHA